MANGIVVLSAVITMPRGFYKSKLEINLFSLRLQKVMQLPAGLVHQMRRYSKRPDQKKDEWGVITLAYSFGEIQIMS